MFLKEYSMKLNFRNLIFLFTLVLLSCSKAPEQPNIVFVFADQLRSQELSCYGGQNVATPHMDQLAQEGLRLTNAISTYPICSPYRAMMLTGMYPMHSGMTNNDHPLRADLPSFAQACNDAGYQTAYIGKWHIDGHGRSKYIPQERRLGFQFFQALECSHDYFKSKYYDNNNETQQQWPGYDAQAQTHSAINYIQHRDKEKPFFLMLSWGPPHGPYIAPPEFMERIHPDSIVIRPNVKEHALADDFVDHPRFSIPNLYPAQMKARILREMKEEHELRQSTVGYYAATLAVDQYLGELLDALEAEGLDDNTIVVFTADHGDQLGSHQFYDKNVPFEESISIPFLLRYPPTVKAQSVSDVLLSPVDVMPSVLALAGIDCPAIDGVDKSKVMLNHEVDTCDAVLLMSMSHFNNTSLINGLDTWRGVRTKRYTYARFEDQTPWLLYDNVADPYQMNNLIGDAKSESLLEQMNTILDDLLIKADDPEDTQAIYDIIIKENPKRKLLLQMREENPGKY